jgi:hypothetical protein
MVYLLKDGNHSISFHHHFLGEFFTIEKLPAMVGLWRCPKGRSISISQKHGEIRGRLT